MAAALLKEAFDSHGIDGVNIDSAGLWVVPGSTVSYNSVKALAARGIDISGHRPKMLDSELVRRADLILTMTRGHKEDIISLFPDAADKVFTIREYAYGQVGIAGDVYDPYGGPLSVYEQTAAELTELAQQVAKQWKERRRNGACES